MAILLNLVRRVVTVRINFHLFGPHTVEAINTTTQLS